MALPLDTYRALVRAHYVGLAQLGDGWRLHVRKACNELEAWDKANYGYGWYEGLLASVDAEYRKQDEAKRMERESLNTDEDRKRSEHA